MSYAPEVVDAIPVQDNSVMALQHKSEIEAMVDTAHKYPRNIAAFQAEATAMATLDTETAQSMFYSVPRSDKHVVGPSVRLAEIIATAWGNLRYGARIVSIDQEFVTAQGFCFDLQKNTGATDEVKRRITNKHGKRFSEDLIQVTCNAACSIARRNAIMRVIPRAYIDQIFAQARDVALGKGESMDSRRSRAMDTLKKFGLSEERILAAVKKPSAKNLDVDDLATLYGLTQSVKHGDRTLEDAFPEPSEETEEPATAKKSSKSAESRTKEKLGIKDPEPAQKAPEPAPESIPSESSEEFHRVTEKWSKERVDAYSAAMDSGLSEGLSTEHAHEAAWEAALQVS